MTSGATKQYELTSVWDILNDVISSNLTDPAIPKRQKSSEWIKNGFPNPGELDTKTGWRFPLVIIRPSELSDEVKVLDQSKHLINHSVSIECSSKTRLEAMQLAEAIRHILQTTAVSDLRTGCVYLTGINGSSEDSDFISGNKYYIYTIDYQFKRFD